MKNSIADGTGSSPSSSRTLGCTIRRRGYRLATMRMPKLKVQVGDKLAKDFQKAADGLWPGQGARATNRLARDSIRIFLRKSASEIRNRG